MDTITAPRVPHPLVDRLAARDVRSMTPADVVSTADAAGPVAGYVVRRLPSPPEPCDCDVSPEELDRLRAIAASPSAPASADESDEPFVPTFVSRMIESGQRTLASLI